MRRVVLSAVSVVLSALAAYSRTVTTGTIVANPGATVSVPVTIDDLSDMGAAVAVIGYDTTVLVCLGVDNGELSEAKDMTYLDSGSGRLCAIFSGFKKTDAGGELMRIRFSVRDGTQGLFSDVTLQDFQCGAKDGVTDLSAANPLSTVNGMVRVMATDASVSQLEEHFTVWPKSTLSSATLSASDKLKASADMSATTINTVTCNGSTPIAVESPIGGWQTGSYALLTSSTEGLSFDLEDATNRTFRTTSSGGKITYWADVVVEGCLEVVAESGSIAAETASQIRSLLESEIAANAGVAKIVVKGDEGLIPIAADLGIAPSWSVLGTTASATYSEPTITIIAFDHETGAVRMKVTPGTGNEIRAAMVTGCVHVYGTGDLKEKMRYISGTGFNLTPYLKSETKGEADLTVALGSYTFIKIKAETNQPNEGEKEQ